MGDILLLIGFTVVVFGLGILTGYVVAVRPDAPPNPHIEVSAAELIQMTPAQLEERRAIFRALRVSLRRAERQMATLTNDSWLGEVMQDAAQDRAAGIK